MLVFFGQGLYGKVDSVPGHFYVKTMFFHAMWFPLIPVDTYLVMAGSEKHGRFKGIRIRSSPKSVWLTYFRAILVLVMIISAVLAIGITHDTLYAIPGERVALQGQWGVAVASAATALVSAFFFLITYFGKPPTGERVKELARIAGIPLETLDSCSTPPVQPDGL